MPSVIGKNIFPKIITTSLSGDGDL